MSVVSFSTKPLGPLGNPYSEDGIIFSAGGLEVKPSPGGSNGLAFEGFGLDIEFEQEAEFVLMNIVVFNSTAIEALDAGGVLVAAPLIYAVNAGTTVALFDLGTPIIHRIRVLGGERENLLVKVRSI